MDGVLFLPFAVHPYQEFLAFTSVSDYMDFTTGLSKTAAYHRNISHRGELDQYMTGNREDFVLEVEDIRSTFFYEEDLLSAFASACRIHVDDIRAE